MSRSLSLSPAGRLIVHAGPEADITRDSTLPTDDFDRVAAAFVESSAAGLIALASERSLEGWGPEWEFWRGFARRLFTGLCGLGETQPAQWQQLTPPPEDELARLAASAPPMRGLEYLDAAALRTLWKELAIAVAGRAAEFPDGAPAYLQHVDPLFHQLGRVTFHLAENKRNPSRPFGFLATYTHRVTEQAKVAHLPLADAVKTIHLLP